jgi:hypothetical protein
MKKIAYLNPISEKGTALWTEDYEKTENVADAAIHYLAEVLRRLRFH